MSNAPRRPGTITPSTTVEVSMGGALAVHDPKLRKWRVRVFTATWLSYFAFYFCRKPFFVTKGTLENELSWDASMLSFLGIAYLAAYTVGQFIASAVGDRWGPRIMLLVGMAVTMVVNASFGFANSYATFAVFLVINGLAQATGWSGNVGSMAGWFTRRERGTVMGFWATNFQIGSIAGKALAAYMLGAFGLKYAYFGGSLVMLVVWIYFVFNQRNRPEDVGLPAIDDPDDTVMETRASGRVHWPRAVVINVALVGCFYFFIKFIRYALWSWAPYLLQQHYGLKGSEAGFVSTIFDIAGFLGVIALGVLSDRLFRGRRVGISMIFVLCMTGACVALYSVGGSSIVLFASCMGLVGFTLYGPDAILTSAGAIDVGSKAAATRAAGIINGLGSIGAVSQEFLLGRLLSGTPNLTGVFLLLLISALGSAVCLGVLLARNRAGKADM
jgi:OPA family sugar phosphate sensor protein UhpC-like MFS transporter